MSLEAQIDKKRNHRFFAFNPFLEHIHQFSDLSNSLSFVPEQAAKYFSRT